MSTFTGECRLSPVNVNIHIVAWCMPKIFAKYPYFSLTPANVDVYHALMVNVEYVGGLHFLLRISGAMKRHKGDVTFSPILLREVTNHGEERDSSLCRGVLTAELTPENLNAVIFFNHYNEKPSDSHWILGNSRFEFFLSTRGKGKRHLFEGKYTRKFREEDSRWFGHVALDSSERRRDAASLLTSASLSTSTRAYVCLSTYTGDGPNAQEYNQIFGFTDVFGTCRLSPEKVDILQFRSFTVTLSF
ncbi:hypothetical protein AVEN_142693-1 [Araneus ventricosus]|uniref:Uncharacterized protein n=1 Tax=Araneus ventricosus TaxID=182803 RepID=A0A4Y2W227_ARAVE|nr:hypothetical protein AVEN_142693-1 [Araneus ventricosus]